MRILPKRFLRTIFRKIHFDKRERFALVTLILTIGLILTQITWFDFRFFTVLFLTIVAYPLSVWGIKEDIKGVEWLTLLILPILFTLSVSLFYFLLPVRWLTRLPTALFYAVGMYAILLSENIFNVAANRSIQLLRAAQSVGFLITLVVLFLFINIILSFHLPLWENFLATVCISVLLYIQFFWSVTLEEKLSKKILLYSICCGIGVGELSLVFSFWPVKTTIEALFMTSIFYTFAGIVQEYLLERLFRGVVRAYLWIAVVVFLLMLSTTHWS